jgi:protein scribble
MNEVDILLTVRLQSAVIQKAGGPLGLSIVGGIDHTSHPFGLEEPGIFISKVGTDC